jgi:hypothetical protein
MLRALYEPGAGASTGFERPARDGPEREDGVRGAVVDLPEPWRAWWQSDEGAAPLEPAGTERHTGARDSKGRSPLAPALREHASGSAKSEEANEAIYLVGGGVVLVHPFLEQLFRERGLLDGKAFGGLEARDRAVRMIGLITFGRADVEEHELVLAKVLCGVPLDEPLEPAPLEDADVAACDALVRAVLEHWTALRSSSPAWLRSQFFLREGKLEDVDSGRRLTIERRAQDVLLARIPWGFGVVALPWLTDRVFVHWLD